MPEDYNELIIDLIEKIKIAEPVYKLHYPYYTCT